MSIINTYYLKIAHNLAFCFVVFIVLSMFIGFFGIMPYKSLTSQTMVHLGNASILNWTAQDSGHSFDFSVTVENAYGPTGVEFCLECHANADNLTMFGSQQISLLNGEINTYLIEILHPDKDFKNTSFDCYLI